MTAPMEHLTNSLCSDCPLPLTPAPPLKICFQKKNGKKKARGQAKAKGCGVL